MSDIICRACGHIGPIETYFPSMGMYSDCRCKCGSTDNYHNDIYSESLTKALYCKHDGELIDSGFSSTQPQIPLLKCTKCNSVGLDWAMRKALVQLAAVTEQSTELREELNDCKEIIASQHRLMRNAEQRGIDKAKEELAEVTADRDTALAKLAKCREALELFDLGVGFGVTVEMYDKRKSALE